MQRILLGLVAALGLFAASAAVSQADSFVISNLESSVATGFVITEHLPAPEPAAAPAADEPSPIFKVASRKTVKQVARPTAAPTRQCDPFTGVCSNLPSLTNGPCPAGGSCNSLSQCQAGNCPPSSACGGCNQPSSGARYYTYQESPRRLGAWRANRPRLFGQGRFRGRGLIFGRRGCGAGGC